MILPLTKQVPDLKLCEEMKALGFPQETLFYWHGYSEKWHNSDKKSYRVVSRGYGAEHDDFAAPTASEIGVLIPYPHHPPRFDSMIGWDGGSEVNARAKCWIHLKKKGVV